MGGVGGEGAQYSGKEHNYIKCSNSKHSFGSQTCSTPNLRSRPPLLHRIPLPQFKYLRPRPSPASFKFNLNIMSLRGQSRRRRSASPPLPCSCPRPHPQREESRTSSSASTVAPRSAKDLRAGWRLLATCGVRSHFLIIIELELSRAALLHSTRGHCLQAQADVLTPKHAARPFAFPSRLLPASSPLALTPHIKTTKRTVPMASTCLWRD